MKHKVFFSSLLTGFGLISFALLHCDNNNDTRPTCADIRLRAVTSANLPIAGLKFEAINKDSSATVAEKLSDITGVVILFVDRNASDDRSQDEFVKQFCIQISDIDGIQNEGDFKTQKICPGNTPNLQWFNVRTTVNQIIMLPK